MQFFIELEKKKDSPHIKTKKHQKTKYFHMENADCYRNKTHKRFSNQFDWLLIPKISAHLRGFFQTIVYIGDKCLIVNFVAVSFVRNSITLSISPFNYIYLCVILYLSFAVAGCWLYDKKKNGSRY